MAGSFTAETASCCFVVSVVVVRNNVDDYTTTTAILANLQSVQLAKKWRRLYLRVATIATISHTESVDQSNLSLQSRKQIG